MNYWPNTRFLIKKKLENVKSIHRVIRGLSTYPKNIRTLNHAFFGAKPHVEQRLLKAFCPLWDILANSFGKKPFGLLSKVLEGRQIEKSLLNKKDGKYP